FPKGLVALDVETTGISPLTDRIIELSAVKIGPDSVELFEHLIKPDIPIPKQVVDIHGITQQMVKDAADISAVMPLFLDFIEDLPLIAHNAKYDLGFVISACHQLKLKWENSPVYCSYILAREILKKTVSDKKLTSLVKFFNLPSFSAHRALPDAAACLHVYAHCLLKADPMDLPSINQKSHIFNLSDFSTGHSFSIPSSMRPIENNIPLQKPLEIKYNAGSHRNKFRPVKPCSLFPLPQGNILNAYCLLSDTYKNFYLHKIAQVREISDNNNSLYEETIKRPKPKKEKGP
ncbi:MAG: 3'-5' exonuclease, partial [Halobacteriovoraceae bacterium]|nr:3'-5' exonuclease [Halobacteriovoraceae bacterium]